MMSPWLHPSSVYSLWCSRISLTSVSLEFDLRFLFYFVHCIYIQNLTKHQHNLTINCEKGLKLFNSYVLQQCHCSRIQQSLSPSVCAGGELHRDVLGWPRPLLPYPPLPPGSPARSVCQSPHHSDCRVLTEGPAGAQLLSQRLRQLL